MTWIAQAREPVLLITQDRNRNFWRIFKLSKQRKIKIFFSFLFTIYKRKVPDKYLVCRCDKSVSKHRVCHTIIAWIIIKKKQLEHAIATIFKNLRCTYLLWVSYTCMLWSVKQGRIRRQYGTSVKLANTASSAIDKLERNKCTTKRIVDRWRFVFIMLSLF